MTDTTVATELEVQQWDSDFFVEYVRDNQFRPYMGKGINSVIQVKEDLTKKKGDTITLPFVGRLNGGVTGSTPLVGAEEQLDNYGFAISVDVNRNAVVFNEFEEQQSAISLRDASKEMLKHWAMEKLRGGGDVGSKFGVIDNLGAVYDGTTYALYGAATEGNKDTWLANNADRVLFGAAVGNNSANDHSLSLANVDSADDTLSAGQISLAKRMAKTATQRVRPVRTKAGEEWFVFFANSLAFRDLKADTTIAQANREAWTRTNGRDANASPIFADGDLIYDGVIIKEVPEIGVISGVGAAAIDVAPGYLCGAQALGSVWAQRTRSRMLKEDDYGFRYGVGVQEIRGLNKLFFNDIQHGVVTVYSAGVADA